MDQYAGAGDVSPRPLYSQIKEVLRELILEGTYPPHSKLPSEMELMRRFKVSRITVRQALRDLQKEGLIFSIQGKGSFVTKPKAVQDLTRLEGFGEAMAQRGHETHSKVLSLKTVKPEKNIAEALHLAKGDEALEIRRIRHLNRTPVSLDISYFPVDLGGRLAKEDLVGRDIFEIMENDYGMVLESAEVTIDATVANEENAGILRVALGSPLLRLERLTYVKDQRPVDFEYLYYIGDAYQYRLKVDRNRI